MKETFRRYPIGIQNFEDLRNNNCVYIKEYERTRNGARMAEMVEQVNM